MTISYNDRRNLSPLSNRPNSATLSDCPGNPGILRAHCGLYRPVHTGKLALVDWSAGCMLIWSTLFTSGNDLYSLTGNDHRLG
ncbi:MAG: hypothetical protein U0903_11820 [Planctomycetales bacterium]